MTTITLKKSLIKKLESVVDPKVLEQMHLLMDMESAEQLKINLSQEQIKILNIAKNSARQNPVPNQEVFKKTKLWIEQ